MVKIYLTTILILLSFIAKSQTAASLNIAQSNPLQTVDSDNIMGVRFDGSAYRMYAFNKWAVIDTAGKFATKSNLATKLNKPTGTTNQYLNGLGNPVDFASRKKQETYSGTTIAAGTYTVTFPVAYTVTPNIQANIVNATDTQNVRTTSITTTGFTVLVRNRVDVVGLLPSWNNVSGATVDVLITEK